MNGGRQRRILLLAVAVRAPTPFAIATEIGWYKQEGIAVELVPLAGSTDCVKNLAT